MKVLTIGNIAQNGYLLTKFFRKAGLEADCLIYSYTHLMGQPEWEDAEIVGSPPHWDADWTLHAPSFVRPDWLYEIRTKNHPWYIRLIAKIARRCLNKSAGNMVSVKDRSSLLAAASDVEAITGNEITDGDIDFALSYTNYPGIPSGFLKNYEVVIGTGVDAAIPQLLAPEIPYIAFSHGTLRDLPFEDSPWGRLLSIGYRNADRVIITNPDCLSSAERLRLDNFEFVPHPIDYKYEAEDQVDRDNESHELSVFCPARHDWSIKGNDILLRGFAIFIKKSKVNARLHLVEWGGEVDRTKQLCHDLSINEYVSWSQVKCSRKLVDEMKAADVVVDQFILGVFGSTTPQALALGKPVITSYDEDLNNWAFSAPPPLMNACTEQEVAAALEELSDRDTRGKLAKQGKEWFRCHHSSRYVTDRFLKIFNKIVGKAE